MTLIYIFSALWSIGCAIAFLWLLKVLFTEEGLGVGLIVLLIGTPIVFLLGGLPWAYIADEASPDLVTLKKNAWVCSASHTEVFTTFVPVGKIIVPQTHTDEVCDQYSRLR